jgi:hypothetical protein
MEEVDGLSYGTRPVRIYWDLENTPKPEFMADVEENKKGELSDIRRNITQTVRAAGMFGSIKIYSYAKETHLLDNGTCNIPGVKFKPVDNGTCNIQYTVLKYMLRYFIIIIPF